MSLSKSQRIFRHDSIHEFLVGHPPIIVAIEAPHQAKQVIVRGIALVFGQAFPQALGRYETCGETVKVLEGKVKVELWSASKSLLDQFDRFLDVEVHSEAFYEDVSSGIGEVAVF